MFGKVVRRMIQGPDMKDSDGVLVRRESDVVFPDCRFGHRLCGSEQIDVV